VNAIALVLAVSMGVNAPDCHRRGGCYRGCYSGGYSYSSCYSSSYAYSPCYSYSGSYGPAADETQEEFDFCNKEGREGKTEEEYSNFRNNVWLKMSHEKRKEMMEKTRKGKGGKGGGEGDASLPRAPVQIVVNLPADAKLTIDDEATKATGAKRVFTSAPTYEFSSYSYTLKMELVRDGKTVAVTKQVTAEAGKETTVSFDDPRAVASR
jgi:uncharacterized protein (TIGR03000 family)